MPSRILLLRAVPVVLLCGLVAGCGSSGGSADRRAQAIEALLWSRTRPFGVGPAFAPPAFGARVAAAQTVAGLRCGTPAGRVYGVHVEVFAANRAVRVPAGIGVAPPQRRAGALVAGGRCSYPMRTLEPTGVVQVAPAAGPSATLGALFALWGQPLGPRRLAGFVAPTGQRVVAYVNGRRWPGDPGGIPLRRHDAVVVEVGTPVRPHPRYVFAPGL